MVRRCCFALALAVTACSPPPPPPPAPRVEPPAPTSAEPARPAPVLSIEGEGLAPVTDLAYSEDGAMLFARRKDGTVEAWRAERGELVRRVSAAGFSRGEIRGTPWEKGPDAVRDADGYDPAIELPALNGIDDTPFIAWIRGLRVAVTPSPRGLRLVPPEGAYVEASRDGRVLVVGKEEKVHVAHRAAHTHFTVTGWTRSFSSRYGYAGDDTTWPGTVTALFGPLPDQLLLESTSRLGASSSYTASRLYDPRTGRIIATLGDSTCAGDRFWSPGGKLIVRPRCDRYALLVVDATTGKSLPDRAGEPPVVFGPKDAALAALYRGCAQVTSAGDPEPRFVVPGPVALRDLELSPDDRTLALLWDDGLDLWDLEAGSLAKHVSAVASNGGPRALERTASGRFYGLLDDKGTLADTRIVVDARTGRVRRVPAESVFHPFRDRLARPVAGGIAVIDLATADTEARGRKATRTIALAFSPDGAALVARLENGSLLLMDDGGRVRARVPPPGRGCDGRLLFSGADRISVSCDGGVRTFAIGTGARLPPEEWRDVAVASPTLPPFAPRALEEALAKGRPAPPAFRATARLLLAGLDPPRLTRAKDGRSVSLHSFAYGAGRAAVVVDEAGRWDANERGAALVRVETGGEADEAEKARRRRPGLLAAFVRGE